MTFFMDANAIVFSALDGEARANCARILTEIAIGNLDGRTSPSVLEEVWHVSRRRYGGRLDSLVPKALTIFQPLVPVTEDALAHALSMPNSRLGPKDRLHVGTCVSHEIDTVLTADRAFDGIRGIRRVDPFDDAAVEKLLAAA